jgi:hypothetical protein
MVSTQNGEKGAVSVREYLESMIATMQGELDRRFNDTHNLIDRVSQIHTDMLNSAVSSQKEAVTAQLASQKEAVEKSEDAATKRFDSVNEFRGVLTAQQSQFVPRVELEARFVALERALDAHRAENAKSIDELKGLINTLQGALQEIRGKNTGSGATWAAIGFGISVLLGLAALVKAFGL